MTIAPCNMIWLMHSVNVDHWFAFVDVEHYLGFCWTFHDMCNNIRQWLIFLTHDRMNEAFSHCILYVHSMDCSKCCGFIPVHGH